MTRKDLIKSDEYLKATIEMCLESKGLMLEYLLKFIKEHREEYLLLNCPTKPKNKNS